MSHKKKLYHHLKERFAKRHKQAVDRAIDRHSSLKKFHEHAKTKVRKTTATVVNSIGAGAIAGALFLHPGPNHVKALEKSGPPVNVLREDTTSLTVTKSSLATLLSALVPSSPQGLKESDEMEITRVLRKYLNMTVGTQMEGNRLNTVYGYMGAEQHLPRYPGDTAAQHDFNSKVGITPHAGAWGYFASSKSSMTQEQVEMEKYYFAVQTFISPGWRENIYELKDWYKHRKMVAVNPRTGDAVVGVVADAGPAVWTNKHFGGSPEVMSALKINGSIQNSGVLLLFVDDPDNQIPLGPVKLSE